jgi:hypothetical protein
MENKDVLGRAASTRSVTDVAPSTLTGEAGHRSPAAFPQVAA